MSIAKKRAGELINPRLRGGSPFFTGCTRCFSVGMGWGTGNIRSTLCVFGLEGCRVYPGLIFGSWPEYYEKSHHLTVGADSFFVFFESLQSNLIMLKTPYRALSGCLRRLPSQCVVGRTVNRAFPTARRFSNGKSEHNGKSRTQEKRKRPMFLASALSATATTIGGTLLYTVVSHEKQKDDEPHYASRAEMELVSKLSQWVPPNKSNRENQAVEEIRKALGEDAVSIEDEILHSHGYSDWSTINIERLPVAVAFPKTTEEVAAIAKICHKRRVPMSKSDTNRNWNGRSNSDKFHILEVRVLKATSQHLLVA